jgi:hypothetical protein
MAPGSVFVSVVKCQATLKAFGGTPGIAGGRYSDRQLEREII